MKLTRKDLVPAILRPEMYTGVRKRRTEADWIADAIIAYLGDTDEAGERSNNKNKCTRGH